MGKCRVSGGNNVCAQRIVFLHVALSQI